MSTNNSQIGHTPSEPFIINMETETNLDQLLSVGILTTSPSSIPLNTTNMIPSQIPTISNHQEDELSRRTWKAQQRQEQQQERQRQQREQRLRRWQRRDQRYERWLENQYQRYREQDQREQEEQEHYRYLQQRSPNFDENMDEILQERELDAYYLERMTPEERQERWLHERLNEMGRISALEQQELMKDEIEQLHQINEFETFQKEKLKYMKTWTEWDQEQLREIERIPIPDLDDPIYDQIEQLQQIDAIEKWQEEEQQQRSQEELQQLKQWEHIAFLVQQLK